MNLLSLLYSKVKLSGSLKKVGDCSKINWPSSIDAN